MKRPSKAVVQAWRQHVTQMLMGAGAEDHDNYTWPIVFYNTPAGPMLVGVNDFWIACRFKDGEKARQYFGSTDPRLNRYSGKWNWHEFEAGPPDTQTNRVVASLLQQLSLPLLT